MIRRTLSKLIRWANSWDDGSIREIDFPSPLRKTSGNTAIGSDNGMNFSLYKASGGYIVEFRQYDRKTDRNDNQLHIINNDDDLGEKIGQIITLELLRN